MNIAAVNYFHKKNKASSKIQKQFLKYKQRVKFMVGVRKFIKRMKALKKLISNQMTKTKEIKFKYFKKYREQVNKIKESLKKKLEEKTKKEKE